MPPQIEGAPALCLGAESSEGLGAARCSGGPPLPPALPRVGCAGPQQPSTEPALQPCGVPPWWAPSFPPWGLPPRGAPCCWAGWAVWGYWGGPQHLLRLLNAQAQDKARPPTPVLTPTATAGGCPRDRPAGPLGRLRAGARATASLPTRLCQGSAQSNLIHSREGSSGGDGGHCPQDPWGGTVPTSSSVTAGK